LSVVGLFETQLCLAANNVMSLFITEVKTPQTHLYNYESARIVYWYNNALSSEHEIGTF